jgi:NADH:ubiquinone oxidoreductase subunit 4 (subunit M)
MDRRELISLAPLVALMLSIGVYPAWVLTVTNQTILNLLGKL